MPEQNPNPIIAIALMAALADGNATTEEKSRLQSALSQLGLGDLDALTTQIVTGQLTLKDAASQLPTDDARKLAYETAVSVCYADGSPNPAELSFLKQLQAVIGLPPAVMTTIDHGATAVAAAVPPPQVGSGVPASPAGLDDLILKQAIITGAVELLPDGLANMAIIPLQLRLVYQIGQAHGQQLDANQVKDLAATLGLGAAAQVMEGAVRRLLGGAMSGLLGGLIGGTTSIAAGAAVTFASTYALGHVAKQYYAQGRRISADDLKALFARFQEEAKTIYPKVQQQVQAQSRSLNLQKLMASVTG
jgi:uncharacterized protein (DUF697 family)/tellurite resistance protein